MSRRESRVSLNAKQNDALFEFENFKKKFLIANKQITKLNSTLSSRIEELNAQISILCTENLRLRASEIALAAQLKREREKSRKIMAEAEAAALGVTKHLGFIRQAFNIQHESPTSPSPTPPRAIQRPPSNLNPSPTSPYTRLSRAPAFPDIIEDEEPSLSSPEENESPPHRRASSKPRLSASKLPLPSRVSSPPPATHIDFAASTTVMKRRPLRRQSGLVIDTRISRENSALSIPRPSSPAFGSPVRREIGLEEEKEELGAVNGAAAIVQLDMRLEAIAKKSKKKAKGKDYDADPEDEAVLGAAGQRKKAKDETPCAEWQPQLKDVTNSPRPKTPAPPGETDELEAASPRSFLVPNPPFSTSLPTPQTSSSPAPESEPDSTATGAGGRERRVRKSVNYTEPKLNTKMRKPDPPEGTVTNVKKKRSSAAAVMVTAKAAVVDIPLQEPRPESRPSVELPLRVNGKDIDPALFPLPQSRPPSVVGVAALTTPSSGSRPGGDEASNAVTVVRRKKSRTYITYDNSDEFDDGADADEEYVPSRGWGVNTEGRRKNAAARKTGLPAGSDRRHSSAV